MYKLILKITLFTSLIIYSFKEENNYNIAYEPSCISQKEIVEQIFTSTTSIRSEVYESFNIGVKIVNHCYGQDINRLYYSYKHHFYLNKFTKVTLLNSPVYKLLSFIHKKHSWNSSSKDESDSTIFC